MNKLQELRDRRAKVISDARALADMESLTEENRSQLDKLLADADGLARDIEREERLMAAEADLAGSRGRKTAPNQNRLPLGESRDGAMAHYIRTGDGGGLMEFRASNNTGMNITTPADGGYAVPTGHYPEIIARLDEIELPAVLGCTDIPGKGTTVNVPIDAEADGEFVTTAEMGDDNTTNVYDRDAPALSTAAMTLVKKTKKIELTEELLEDEDSNLMRFLVNWVARGIARTRNQMLLTEVLANGTAALSLDAAAAIGATEIPELVYLLPDPYQEGKVAWVMRRATEGAIRGLAGNNFQFAPTPAGMVAGARPGLWTYPVYNSQYAGAMTTGQKSLVLANWEYVGKRNGTAITFLRDPYTVDGKVILKYSFRQVYKVLQAEAVLYATQL